MCFTKWAENKRLEAPFLFGAQNYVDKRSFGDKFSVHFISTFNFIVKRLEFFQLYTCSRTVECKRPIFTRAWTSTIGSYIGRRIPTKSSMFLNFLFKIDRLNFHCFPVILKRLNLEPHTISCMCTVVDKGTQRRRIATMQIITVLAFPSIKQSVHCEH